MDREKKKYIFAIVGILALILAILALFRYRQVQLDSQRVAIEKKVTQMSQDKLLSKAEEAVKRLEADKKEENIAKAQEAVDAITDKDSREKLQNRIKAVKDELAKKAENDKLQAKAEKAVKTLENHPSQENVSSAQEAVNKVLDKKVKEGLQARIDKVKSALSDHEQGSLYPSTVTEVVESAESQEVFSEIGTPSTPNRSPQSSDANSNSSTNTNPSPIVETTSAPENTIVPSQPETSDLVPPSVEEVTETSGH